MHAATYFQLPAIKFFPNALQITSELFMLHEHKVHLALIPLGSDPIVTNKKSIVTINILTGQQMYLYK